MSSSPNSLKLQENDEHWMRYALNRAKRAGSELEVPVGAVLVCENQIVASAHNKKETWNTPLGHAEMICIHRASQKLARWRLSDATLYVTLEPCPMCAGLLVQSRIGRVVFGALDPKAGAIHSLFQIANDPRLNHRCEITAGILGDECGQLLKDFFKQRRQK